jgi:hypothetical protein
MSMNEWYFFFTPLAALAALLLFRFAGCKFTPPEAAEPTFGIPYHDEVKSDNPAGYWRLNETTGDIANNEITGSLDGNYGQAANPLSEGDPNHRSPAANPIILQLGQPSLLASDAVATSIKVQGAFVFVQPSGPLNPPEFTLEALVLPEWNLGVLGKYYCVMESSSRIPGQPDSPKIRGYALYAGPDDPNNPNSPYHWQLWVGDGNGFVRLTEKPYNEPANPGPVVLAVPTYLAVTFTPSEALLYMYVKDRNFNHIEYELNPAAYQAAVDVELFVGVTDNFRPLFPPFPGPSTVMYPFVGRIQEVAIYAAALEQNRIGSHANAAIEGV